MKQNILMVLHLPPPIHGAAIMGEYLKQSELINDSFSIDYINLSTSTKLKEIGKGGIRKLISSLRIVSKVLTALSKKKYDLSYMTLTSSSSGFYKDLMIVVCLKLAGVKIIYHFHNKGVSTRQSRWLDNMLYRFVFKGTRSILLSPSLYPDIKKYVKREDVFFCPNGISCFENVVERVHDVNKPCQLLFLSHMMVEKGVVTLLDACRLLKGKGHKFECHFVGAWTNISDVHFKQLVLKRELDENVFAHGPRFNGEKSKFFTNADIFVFPTYNECFGLVLLEAMSFGLPIVATSEGGIPDIVINEKTGFIVEKKNSIALASRLQILITNPELRKEYGAEGRKRLLDHFTIEKYESNMLQILKTSCNSKKYVPSVSESPVIV